MQYTYPQGKTLALTFSYDDGHVFDRQLIEIFNRYGMKGTFHLNSGRLGSAGHHGAFVNREELTKLYAMHEVACHGVEHKDPLLLSEQELFLEYSEDRRTLEELTCGFVQGLSYAYGRYQEKTKHMAAAVGLKYSRTVCSTHDFMLPADFLEWHPTCHFNDPMLMELGKNLLDSPPHREMPLLYVWGHSYEFDRDGTWGRMEEFCKMMAGQDKVWYATNLEICEYVNALRSLEYSADGMGVYNPSAIPVWKKDGERLIVLEPGKVTRMD